MKWLAPLLLLCAASAHASPTGDQLLAQCGQEATAYCRGFVAATASAGESMDAACAPRWVTPKQEVDVVMGWLKTNPSHRHHDGFVLSLYVLSIYFPCKNYHAQKRSSLTL